MTGTLKLYSTRIEKHKKAMPSQKKSPFFKRINNVRKILNPRKTSSILTIYFARLHFLFEAQRLPKSGTASLVSISSAQLKMLSFLAIF